MKHPREILLGAQAAGAQIPVCDHYSGVETRMLKSLQLQAELTEEFGACLFDVTLDCEDGAPVGGEVDHATLLRRSPWTRLRTLALRCGSIRWITTRSRPTWP